MGASSSTVQKEPETVANTADGKKLKPCCACPETKRARDQCIMERGEANCQDLIEAHKECMRQHGFKI